MHPITHPLAIALVNALTEKQATYVALLHAESNYGRSSAAYAAAKRAADVAADRAVEAQTAWNKVGCLRYADPGPIPAPALGMRMWAVAPATGSDRRDAVESRTWDVDWSWPGMTWDDVTHRTVSTADIVLITDYREGGRTIWKRPPSTPKTPQ